MSAPSDSGTTSDASSRLAGEGTSYLTPDSASEAETCARDAADLWGRDDRAVEQLKRGGKCPMTGDCTDLELRRPLPHITEQLSEPQRSVLNRVVQSLDPASSVVITNPLQRGVCGPSLRT